MRRNWVVAGIPGEQARVGSALLPPLPVLDPPLPVLDPPLPVLDPPLPVLDPPLPVLEPPLPVPTLPPVPELELPPVPVRWPFMAPVQLAALASRTPARPVRMKCLICVYPSAGGTA